MSNIKEHIQSKWIPVLLILLIIFNVFALGFMYLQMVDYQYKKAYTTINLEFPLYSTKPYGMGLYFVEVYDNNSGSWVLSANFTGGKNTGIEMNHSASAHLVVAVALNKTHLGWDSNPDAWNYFKVDLELENLENHTIVYSTTNMTSEGQYGTIANPLYFCTVEHTINLLLEQGIRYSVHLDVQVYTIPFVNAVYGYRQFYGWVFTNSSFVNDWWFIDHTKVQLESDWDDTIYFRRYLNHYTNTSWDDAINDLVQSAPSSSENKFVFNGGDDYGQVQDNHFAPNQKNIVVNSWLLINVTDFYDTGAGGADLWLQARIDGTWRYYLGGHISSAGVYYHNMSAYAGLTMDSLIFAFDSVTTNDYFTLGSLVMYQNQTPPMDHNGQFIRDEGISIDPNTYTDFSTNGISFSNGSPVHTEFVCFAGLDNGSYVQIFNWTGNPSVPCVQTNISLSDWTWGSTTITALVWGIRDTEGTAFSGGDIYNLDPYAGDWGTYFFEWGYLDEWYTIEDTEVILYTELFKGMLFVGLGVIGLAMIPSGSVFGAMLIKAKKFNEKTWMIPVAIVLLGFAFFIGGMA